MWLAVAVLALVAACGPAAAPLPWPTPTLAPSAAVPPTASPASNHVFVIVMENKSPAQALDPAAAPFTAGLVTRYASLTNYHAISHPSLPNYLAVTSGQTWGITDDGYHQLPESGLGDQLSAAGVSWRAYMEDMTRGCFDSPPPYALKHNPFAYYGGRCPDNVVAFPALDADLAASTPRFVWITPNLCNDTHDCPVATGDRWLSVEVPKITASSAWQADGVLFITWDEDDSANRVATLVIAPNLARHESQRAYDHYSLLATIEERLGVGRLGAAATASLIDDL